MLVFRQKTMLRRRATEMKTADFFRRLNREFRKPKHHERVRVGTRDRPTRLPGQKITFWRNGGNGQLAIEVTAASRT
jgi:hypothetical protein